MAEVLQHMLLQEAGRALGEIAPGGAMPAGCNGPYGDHETALRNTGHWCIMWCWAHEATGEDRFHRASEQALTHIMQPENRPSGASWKHREGMGKDACNGVIGAAWTIEALTCAAAKHGREDALCLARDAWKQFEFDAVRGLWHPLEIDGRILPIDKTFNHQLWFATAVARLEALGVEETKFQLDRFMDCLSSNFTVYPSGLVRHRIRLNFKDYLNESGSLINRLHARYKQLRSGAAKPMDARLRDVGYHAYNLHAFAALKELRPAHPFWGSKVLKHAINFGRSREHIDGVSGDNPFAYPYNPVGFEMAYALKVFVAESGAERDQWCARQIEFMETDDGYGYAANDPATARARLYEALPVF